MRILNGFRWPLGWSADGETVFAYSTGGVEIVAVPRRGGTPKVVWKQSTQRVGLAPSPRRRPRGACAASAVASGMKTMTGSQRRNIGGSRLPVAAP
jgi:hypothetical protein